METLTVLSQCQCFQIISVIFLVLFSPITATNDSSGVVDTNDYTSFGIFHSLQSILDTLNSEKYKGDDGVLALLSVYERLKPLYQSESQRLHPCIVVEGYYTKRRKLISKKLAQSLGARLLTGLPYQIAHLRDQFQRTPEYKSLFYALAHYLTGSSVRKILRDQPVVISGYWMVNAIFNLVKNCKELPPHDSYVYKFPEDLLKPDMIFYVSSTLNEQMYSSDTVHLRNSIVEAYSRMRDPVAYDFNSTYFRTNDLENMRDCIRDRLKSKFPHAMYL